MALDHPGAVLEQDVPVVDTTTRAPDGHPVIAAGQGAVSRAVDRDRAGTLVVVSAGS